MPASDSNCCHARAYSETKPSPRRCRQIARAAPCAACCVQPRSKLPRTKRTQGTPAPQPNNCIGHVACKAALQVGHIPKGQSRGVHSVENDLSARSDPAVGCSWSSRFRRSHHMGGCASCQRCSPSGSSDEGPSAAAQERLGLESFRFSPALGNVSRGPAVGCQSFLPPLLLCKLSSGSWEGQSARQLCTGRPQASLIATAAPPDPGLSQKDNSSHDK